MRRFLFPFRVFFLLFETAGLPPVTAVVQGLTVPLVWIGLGKIASDLPEVTVFYWTVFMFLLAGSALRLGAGLNRVGEADLRSVVRYILLIWAALFALILWMPDPVWIQRIFTCFPIFLASGLLIDMLDGKDTLGTAHWPAAELDHARPALTRAFFLLHLGIAVLNETLIATQSPEVWLIYLMLLPSLMHFIATALTTTVLLDLDRHG